MCGPRVRSGRFGGEKKSLAYNWVQNPDRPGRW